MRQIDLDVKLAQLSAMTATTPAATIKRWTAPLLGLLLATSTPGGPAGARMLSPRSGGSCISYDRAYPNGTTLACMVQPGPNTLCRGLMGLTVKLWTCNNGTWVMK